MKNNGKGNNNNKNNNNRFIPNSLKFISSCIKTASSGVRSASASVAASITGDNQDRKDQVLWASFDRLELCPSCFKQVLLLGYTNGFQVIDVEDASNVHELVSKRDDPVTFLQMQPYPPKYVGHEGFRAAHPLLLVVACDEAKSSVLTSSGRDGSVRDCYNDLQRGKLSISPTTVRFYSLRSQNYVHVLRFRSTVYMVRCNPHILAIGLASQIYCFDAVTLENKFSVLTYPVAQLGGQGMDGVNVGYGPMAVGPRWLAYASDNPLVSNTGRLSPQTLTPPMGVSPSTSPCSGSLMALYAMESGKQLANGLMNLGDKGYKTLSRYYQDLIPDGSNPPVYSNLSSNGRGATHSAETENAGMVVIRDFVSRAVVSQFKAHTSPISALCFDPSGTLLVTASIHGNNINIFRIMPSSLQSGSGRKNFEWSSSHVHLYKLHRGFTSAVIQDICFSDYSEWIAIVSSRGTSHIFVLSPFGGENVLQIQKSHVDGPSLLPVLSLPWWFTQTLTVNQQSFSALPPSPVTLSVITRIKNNNSGWFNTVSNAASCAAGKTVQSGAIAAVFHKCVPQHLQPAHVKNVNALEHLLVYTPCGHLVQHKLLSSVQGESTEFASRIGQGSLVQIQEDELRVNVEAVQSWDVCRGADWLEREECISGITLGKRDFIGMSMGSSDSEDNDPSHQESLKSHEQSHLYLSNAEVQMCSWRIPLWQKPKMSFLIINHLETMRENIIGDHTGGEVEVENAPVQEVEIRQKDLLPVFEHFHRILSNESSLKGYNDVKELEDAVLSHSKSVSDGLVAKSNSGLSAKYYSLQSGNITVGQGGISVMASPFLHDYSTNKDTDLVTFKQSQMAVSPEDSSPMNNSVTAVTNNSLCTGRAISEEVQLSRSGVTSEASNASSGRSDMSMNIIDEGDFEQLFQEGYCNISPLNEHHESTKMDSKGSSSPCDLEKSEGDNEEDDMLGGVFAFSEDGRTLEE